MSNDKKKRQLTDETNDTRSYEASMVYPPIILQYKLFVSFDTEKINELEIK